MIPPPPMRNATLPKKPTGRARTVRKVARPLSRPPTSGAAPLLDVPAEIALEIMEFALLHTPSHTLALVSKAFNDLVCRIIYRTVVLDSLERIDLFNRTIRSKSLEFFNSHVRTLAVISKSYNINGRMQMEEIIAACPGLRTLVIPRPGILASPLISSTTPSEVIIQGFDAVTPFEFDPLFGYVRSPAAHISTPLTHLRICEPGQVWHSPLSILEFFGPLPHLTHLALAQRVSPTKIDNDTVFVQEVRVILANRPNLKIFLVNIFPARWPKPTRAAWSLCSYSCICKALIHVAETDRRLVLLTTGWDTIVEEDEHGFRDIHSTSPPSANHGSWRPGAISFWDNWRMSDKRVVSLAAGWEPEVLQDDSATKWSYTSLATELRERNIFWEHWPMPE
ncbi:hypothetical protein C8R43DRAFT_945033 [Mycena crocata]|nr:hypothetical protein C8R43DRAFT_945033 [Mycena crocata]